MKMVVYAGVIAVLIVCGAYFGSHWYYGDDPIPLMLTVHFLASPWERRRWMIPRSMT